MDYNQLLTYFQDSQQALMDTIRQYVEMETPSSDKERLDAFVQELAGRYVEAGARVEFIEPEGEVEERGNHLKASLDDNEHVANTGADPALILCHYDTVWPAGALETHPFRVDEKGLAYGPGIFDMQSSLALVEYFFRAVHDLDLTLPRPVVVLVTSDEEVGSPTSRSLIEEEAKKAAYVLVMESPLPGGVLKTARKGIGNFTLTVTGRAAHAGVEPEKGVSAVQEIAHQILRLHGLNRPEEGTTVNVGVVRGGSRSNVIAAEASAQIDARSWSREEMNRICDAIYSLSPVMEGAKLVVEGGENRPALEPSVTRPLFKQARSIGARLGLDLKEGSTGGGSDGNLTGALGVPTLDGLGVPGEGAHADHEHIEVDQIPGRAALLTALVLDIES